MALSGLVFPTCDEPAASLVVVVYGQYRMARRTLEAIAESTDEPYEVIVVDNASPDAAGARLREEVQGARFLLNPRNLGFPAAADLGALHARGRHVGILNADLEPRPGWLSPLVRALDDDPRAGAATPMYLEPDARVQEAGVVLGEDGIGYGYGDRLAADAPEVCFRRYVDYGSAAALLVRREAFGVVGGFDPVYGLGYYEDADLGFSLRAAAYETVYEPASKVVHLGHGAFDQASRVRQLQANRPVFVQRFGPQLQGRPLLRRPPFDPHKDLVVRDWWAPDRLLVLDATGALATFAADVQAAWPCARVTWVPTSPRAAVVAAAAGHPGVERFGVLAELGDWLEGRRFHYGAVVTDDGTAGRVSGPLRRSQPQAIVGLVGAAASDGVGPAGVVVLPDRPAARAAMPALGFGPAARPGDR